MSAVAVVAIGTLASIGFVAWRSLSAARADYANLEAAWPHREKIANIVGKLESDQSAPPKVRMMAAFLADHAFDRKEMRSIIHRNSSDTAPRIDLRKKLREEFGERYGQILETLIKEFAFVVMYQDAEMGWHLRRRKQAEPTKEEAKRRAPMVWDALKDHGCGAAA